MTVFNSRRKSGFNGIALSNKTIARDELHDGLVQYGSIAFLYIFYFVLVLISWGGSPFEGIIPFWTMIAVFVMSARCPDMLPGSVVFMTGLMTDIVLGSPLGVHAFSLLLVAFLARLQQRFLGAQIFIAVWADFAVLSFLFTFIVGGLNILAFEEFDAVMPYVLGSLWSWLALVVIYPILSIVMHGVISLARSKHE